MWLISAIDEFSFQNTVEANHLTPEFCGFVPADKQVRKAIIDYIQAEKVVVDGIFGCYTLEEITALGVV